VYSGGCDGAVKCYDLATGQATTLHTHDKPVNCVGFIITNGQEILISAGWDKQLRVSCASQTLRAEKADRHKAMTCPLGSG
jgi:WD40 repeat protein